MIYVLENGRIYRTTDTGKPYVTGEYPSGGIHIAMLLESGRWGYLDNSPDTETVTELMRALARLRPMDLTAALERLRVNEPEVCAKIAELRAKFTPLRLAYIAEPPYSNAVRLPTPGLGG